MTQDEPFVDGPLMFKGMSYREWKRRAAKEFKEKVAILQNREVNSFHEALNDIPREELDGNHGS